MSEARLIAGVRRHNLITRANRADARGDHEEADRLRVMAARLPLLVLGRGRAARVADAMRPGRALEFLRTMSGGVA